MIKDLLCRLNVSQWLYRVQWPTREPRPAIWTDGRPTLGQMLKELPPVIRRPLR